MTDRYTKVSVTAGDGEFYAAGHRIVAYLCPRCGSLVGHTGAHDRVCKDAPWPRLHTKGEAA